MNIAERHLLPKQLREHGLDSSHLQLPQDSLKILSKMTFKVLCCIVFFLPKFLFVKRKPTFLLSFILIYFSCPVH